MATGDWDGSWCTSFWIYDNEMRPCQSIEVTFDESNIMRLWMDAWVGPEVVSDSATNYAGIWIVLRVNSRNLVCS